MNPIRLDLMTILSEIRRDSSHVSQATAAFSRGDKNLHLEEGALRIVWDRLPDADLFLVSFGVEVIAGRTIEVTVAGVQRILQRVNRGLLLTVEAPDCKAIWFGAEPKIYRFDEEGRIQGEFPCVGEWSLAANSGHWRSVASADGTLVFSVLLAGPKSERSVMEAFSLEDAKLRVLAVEGESGAISHPCGFWSFYVLGQIYNPKLGHYGRLASTQTAFGLYKAFLALERLEGLEIYRPLRLAILSSAMDSLGKDGLWRQGEWCRTAESHARLQIDGLHLLMEGNRLLQDKDLADAAGKALAGLMTLSDDLGPNGLWFLHDNLEKEERPDYQTYQKALATRVLGKSLHNTLCLNTHVYALTALKRFADTGPDPSVEAALDRGIVALDKVLDLAPFWPTHHAMGFLIDLTFRNGLVGKTWNRLALRWTKEKLYRWNKKRPCLVLPNGFILRDLELPLYGLWYHVINLFDLMTLWLSVPTPRVTAAAMRGWEYLQTGGLIDFLHEKRLQTLPELSEVYAVALRCGFAQDPSWVARQLNRLWAGKIPFHAGVYGFNPIIGKPPKFISRIPEVLAMETPAGTFLLNLSQRPVSLELPRDLEGAEGIIKNAKGLSIAPVSAMPLDLS